MKSFAVVAAFAGAIAGNVIAHGHGAGARDPADAMRAQCALYLHFDYDRERCFDILQERQAAAKQL